MSMRLQMRFESGLLKVDATGGFSLEEAKRTFLEMLEAAVRFRATKILFDGRNLKGKPEVMERFYYGEFAANETSRFLKEHPVLRAPRYAYVFHEPLRDPRRFGETVAVNRGMVVKTFEAAEEASAWLEVTPANKPDAGDA